MINLEQVLQIKCYRLEYSFELLNITEMYDSLLRPLQTNLNIHIKL